MTVFLGREITLWLTFIRCAILAGATFGLHWTADQIAATMFTVEALFALLGRQSVTSNSTLREAGYHPADVKVLADISRANGA